MIEVDVNNAYKLISLGSVIMISSSLNGKLNVMANAWNCPLDFSPSKVLVIVGRESTTRHYIDESGEFIINVASSNQKDLVVKVGS
jgi:flavin reductase (DIM6/NTAB) family NADH-FMN oxidoreductase RutF